MIYLPSLDQGVGKVLVVRSDSSLLDPSCFVAFDAGASQLILVDQESIHLGYEVVASMEVVWAAGRGKVRLLSRSRFSTALHATERVMKALLQTLVAEKKAYLAASESPFLAPNMPPFVR